MSQQNCTHTIAPIDLRTGRRPWLPIRRFCQRLQVWQERSRQRRMLATLSDRALRDIGLTRADVFQEISKPFWRP